MREFNYKWSNNLPRINKHQLAIGGTLGTFRCKFHGSIESIFCSSQICNLPQKKAALAPFELTNLPISIVIRVVLGFTGWCTRKILGKHVIPNNSLLFLKRNSNLLSFTCIKCGPILYLC